VSNGVDLKMRGLEGLIKAFKGKIPKVRVGVLGGGKRADGQSNAEVGARHEFGTFGMPQRSFLRVPLTEQLEKFMERSGAFDEAMLKKIANDRDLGTFGDNLAAVAEDVVLEAFHTGGFGKWAPWKTPGYQNNTGQILVDTQQLRNSITSEVKA